MLANDSAPDSTVILALEQTAGKGQRGNVWESRTNQGLYCSIIFKPVDFAVTNLFLFNKAVAVGVATFLENRLGKEVCIKWPNDILVDGRKIAGLLIENSLRGDRILAIISGIGINLNQIAFPDSFDTNPTSMKLETGSDFYPAIEVRELFRYVYNAYQQFLMKEDERINAAYHHLLYGLNTAHSFIREGAVFTAELQEVRNDGSAILLFNGSTIVAHHPAVRFFAVGKSSR
jgi:BirA family biotin operon repressor/biotin-[acetyl-CoA-carboxylase] ligase